MSNEQSKASGCPWPVVIFIVVIFMIAITQSQSVPEILERMGGVGIAIVFFGAVTALFAWMSND